MKGFKSWLAQGALALGLAFTGASAADLPTAASIASEMGLGWNLGNTMEAGGGNSWNPTAWGNPLPTQRLIDSVKAAGFKTVRIPAAWNGYANASTYAIDPAWMAQVKQAVDLCIKDSLFVVLNIHWDGGWLETNVTDASKDAALKANILAKQKAYWGQIAHTFKDYDRHLLFAGANEPEMSDTATFQPEAMATLKDFYQTFIDTVRASGGNNATRTLIVQGPKTDVEMTSKLMPVSALPTDQAQSRLMVEVHYYTPYQFCLMDNDAEWGQMHYYWGTANLATDLSDTARNSKHYGDELYMDSLFALMKAQFVDQGYPVLLGEFGAMKRTTLGDAALLRHLASRRSFYQSLAASALKNKLIPVLWDAGVDGNNSMSIFDRASGSFNDLGSMNALRKGFGMSELPGWKADTIGQNSLKVLYSAKDSARGQVDIGVSKKDISAYESIIVRAYVKGSDAYDSAGIAKNGFLSLSLVTMSDGWTWREANLGAIAKDSWVDYSIPLGRDTTVKGALVPADPESLQFLGLQAYSHGFHGTIYVDHLLFVKKDGTKDTLYSFNVVGPKKFSGNVVGTSLIANSQVATDKEWESATKSLSVPAAPSNAGAYALKVLYSAKDSLRGQVELGVAKKDISAYDSVIVRTYVNGETNYTVAGKLNYGFVSLSLVTMSDGYTWRDASLGEIELGSWQTFSIPLGRDTTEKGTLVPADPTALDFFALQAYSKGFHGTIYVDYIVFVDNEGSRDTLYNFNGTAPTKYSDNVQKVSTILVSKVESDTEWKTATTSKYATTAVWAALKAQEGLRVMVSANGMQVEYSAAQAGPVQLSIKNLQGQSLATREFFAQAGSNRWSLPASFNGVVLVEMRQGSRILSAKTAQH